MAKKRMTQTEHITELVDPQGRVERTSAITAGVEAELIKYGWSVRRTTRSRSVVADVCDSCKENLPNVHPSETTPGVYCSECV